MSRALTHAIVAVIVTLSSTSLLHASVSAEPCSVCYALLPACLDAWSKAGQGKKSTSVSSVTAAHIFIAMVLNLEDMTTCRPYCPFCFAFFSRFRPNGGLLAAHVRAPASIRTVDGFSTSSLKEP